jgi:hypothetical protein
MSPVGVVLILNRLRVSSSLDRMFQEERSILWEVIVSVILSKKVYVYMCPIPNGFRDRAMNVIARINKRQDALRQATLKLQSALMLTVELSKIYTM